MAQKDLIPFNERSEEEVKAMQRKGGINSGKTRRNKALLRDCLEVLMSSKNFTDENGKKITGAEALSVSLFQKALNEGDTAKAARAFETLRDTAGQKLPDKVEQTNTNITIDFGDLEEDGN